MLSLAEYPTKPAPPSVSDQRRWEHTGLRLRMLSGTWQEDLRDELNRRLSPGVRAVRGPADLGSNVHKSMSTQLGTALYLRPPTVSHLESEAAAPLLDEQRGLLTKAGLWPLMQRVATWTVGCREALLHIDADTDPVTGDPKLLIRPVSADNVVARALPEDPATPVELWELRLRVMPDTHKPEWTWDVWCVDGVPYRRVHSVGQGGKLGKDITALILGRTFEGPDYPWRWGDGRACLPWTLYHAEVLGDRLFDPYEGIEVVHGTLTAACLWSFFVHCVQEASWPQRWGLNVKPVGATIVETAKGASAAVVENDPTAVLLFEPIADGVQAVLSQWQTSSDPAAMQEAIAAYEQRIAEYFGVAPTDLQRLGGTARSGYAIALTNAGKREAQRRYTPQFRAADLRTISVAAAVLNSRTRTSLPEEGYQITYQAIPLSDAEMQATREDLLAKMDAGLLSVVDAYRELNPGTSRETAISELVRIKQDNAKLRARPAAPPPPPMPPTTPPPPPEPSPEDEEEAA